MTLGKMIFSVLKIKQKVSIYFNLLQVLISQFTEYLNKRRQASNQLAWSDLGYYNAQITSSKRGENKKSALPAAAGERVIDVLTEF